MQSRFKTVSFTTLLLLVLAIFLAMPALASPAAKDTQTSSSAALVNNSQTPGAEITTSTAASKEAVGTDIAKKMQALKQMISRATQIKDYGKVLAQKAYEKYKVAAAGTLKSSGNVYTAAAPLTPAAQACNIIMQI